MSHLSSNPDGGEFDLELERGPDARWFLHLIDPDTGRRAFGTLSHTQVQQLAAAATGALAEHDAPEVKHPDMQVQVVAHRYTSGRESAWMSHVALTYEPAETVESLVRRALQLDRPFALMYPGEHVTLRVAEGTEGRPEPGSHPVTGF